MHGNKGDKGWCLARSRSPEGSGQIEALPRKRSKVRGMAARWRFGQIGPPGVLSGRKSSLSVHGLSDPGEAVHERTCSQVGSVNDCRRPYLSSRELARFLVAGRADTCADASYIHHLIWACSIYIHTVPR